MKRLVSPQARAEMAAATRWFEKQETGLGARFLSQVEKAFERIDLNPYLYQEVDPEIRRARMHPFPYGIFYAVVEDTIQILGVVDDRRDPSIWKGRGRNS
jgi:plasmid stabilization system protein ParE